MAKSYWDEEWISKQRERANKGLKSINRSAFMEIQITLCDLSINVQQGELLRQVRQAQIHTFGWPIAIVLERSGLSPIPTNDGIQTEVIIPDSDRRNSYDYWMLRKNGDFYLLKSIFEDERRENTIFFNTRIVRITETLLYASRLYSGLNVPKDAKYLVGIRHGGLKGRLLSTSSIARRFFPSTDKASIEDEVYTEVETTIEKTESQLVDLVEKFTQPLFIVFNFFELNKSVLEEIVKKFVAGEVT